MRNILSIKLLLLFATAFSMAAISGPIASYGGGHILPVISPVRADLAPATNWVPAGPAMDTEKVNIFVNSISADTALQAEQIDLSDEPILSGDEQNCFLNGAFCSPGVNKADFFMTSPINPEKAYYGMQFLLSNNFWGVPFNFGNDASCTAGSVSYSLSLADPKTSSTTGLSTLCPGVSIRQGIAHLVDKNTFTSSAMQAPGCFGAGFSCVSLDHPVPWDATLETPNSCGWDTLFPATLESSFAASIGDSCGVGVTGLPTIPNGGIAYHFATSAACGPSIVCTTTPLYTWEPGFGTPDFCAAADHFIAAGIATGKDPNTCALTGISPPVTAHTVNIFIQATTSTEVALGNSVFDEICALFTGVFQNANPTQCETTSTTTSVTSGPYVTKTLGPVGLFPGFSTSNNAIISNDWWVYVGDHFNRFPFDQTLYGAYNSINVSNNGAADVPPCSTSSVATVAAGDYAYNCIPLYDQLSNAMEFALCINSANGPFPGQTNPTFGNCSNGTVTGNCNLTTNPCDAVSAGYQAENLFGQQAVAVPVFYRVDLYGYLAHMSNVINSQTIGIPQFYTWLNAHTSTPAASGALLQNCPSAGPTSAGLGGPVIGGDCFRQAFSQNTVTLNPYTASNFWDSNILGNIYDSLLRENPTNPAQLICWMTVQCPILLPNSQLGYIAPPGTIASYRFTLRSDIFWQDGHPLTASDVRFTFLTCKAVGAFQCSELSAATDVHVLSATTFDVNLAAIGPFILYGIGSVTIIPGRQWSSTCSGTIWDNFVSSGAETVLSPSTNPGLNTWTAPINGFTLNGVYTTSGGIGDQAQYAGYGSPGSAESVKIGIYGHQAIGGTNTVEVDYSVDNGLTWNIAGTFTPTSVDTNAFYDVTNQQLWTPILVFGLQTRIIHKGPGIAVTESVDYVPVKAGAPSGIVPKSCMSVSNAMASPHFDPLAAGILVGSGPYECAAVSGLADPSGATIGGGCSSTGTENPNVSGYYQLTQFGAGTTPGTSLPSTQYFRNSGKLAVYIWSGNNGGSTHDFINSSVVANCFLKAVGTPGCTQWQQGISNPAASPGAVVNFLQVSAAISVNGVHWTAPFDYLPGIPYACCPFTANAPTGVAPLPLLLYAGVSNGNSGNPFASGTEEILSPAATAGCAFAYPTGGYDC